VNARSLLLLAPLLLLASSPAHAWTSDGDTITTYYQGGPRTQLVLDGAGGVFVGGHVILGTTDNLFPRHYDTTGVPVGSWTQHVESPYDFTLDGTGGMYTLQRGPGIAFTTLVADHWTPAGAVDPSWPYGGATVVDGTLGLGTITSAPAEATDDSNGVYVSCVLDDARVLGWRLLANGSLADGWPPEGVVYRDIQNEAMPNGLASIPDDSGGVIVAAENYSQTGSIFMRAWRKRSNGLSKWNSVASGDHTTGGPVIGLVLAHDHVYYCWANDVSPTVREVRLQSLSLANFGHVSPGWPANGLLVTQGHPDTLRAQLLPDQTDGAYIAWSRGPSIVAVRIDSTGALVSGWPATGVSLIDAGATPIPGTNWIAASAQNGIIACWTDARDGVARLWVRFLWSDGTLPVWETLSGRIVASTNPLAMGFIHDGGVGVYVAWESATWPQGPYNSFIVTRMPYGDITAVEPPPVTATGALHVRVWPDPASRELDLALTLPDASPARVELLDVTGHRVRSLEVTGAGPRTTRFDRLDALPSGMYFLRVSQRGLVQTTRVALIH
jgi:hypothetical protein